MQVNGVNSFSNAQAFRGEEGKKINKKAIAAGVIAAAAVATTVAAGLHGKKIAGEQVTEEAGKGFKKIVNYVKSGYSDAWSKVSAKANEAIDAIKEKFGRRTAEVEDLTEDLAQGAERAADEVAEASAKAVE